MNKKEIIEKLKNSLFFRVLKLIKLNKKPFLLTLVFDLLFLISLYLFSQLLSSLIGANLEQIATFFTLPSLTIISLLLFSITYICLLILIYSFFKYCILDIIKSMTEKTGFSFRRFGRFFLLNLIIFASVFIIFLAITIIISLAIKKQYLQITTLIVLVLLALITYSFLNFSHSYFMLKPGSIKSTLKSSLKKTFRRLSSYYKIYIISLLFFIAYIIIYYPFALLLKSTLPQNALRYLPIYVRAFTIITLIIIYLITAHNRIYFYMNTKEAITPL